MKKSINTFDDLYFSALGSDGIISSFISGHLMVEFMLVKIIEINYPKLCDFAKNLNHYKLVKLTLGLGLISDGQAKVLFNINGFRNKFAHNITFRPTVAELRSLFIEAKENFADLTDGLIQGIEELEGKSSISDCEDYIFSELFIQIAYDLHGIYQEHGGDEIEFKKKQYKAKVQ